jgi:hypothetical protein
MTNDERLMRSIFPFPLGGHCTFSFSASNEIFAPQIFPHKKGGRLTRGGSRE